VCSLIHELHGARFSHRTAWRKADRTTALVYSIVRADNPRSSICA